MKNPILLALATIIAALCAAAQPAPETILAKNLEAIGGAEAHMRLKTRRSVGKITMAALGVKAPIEILAKAPKLQLSTVTLPGLGKIQEGCDGRTAWSASAFTGTKEKAGADLKAALAEADFYRDANLAKINKNWSYGGKANVGGRPASRLQAVNPAGNAVSYFFDDETGLVVRVSESRPTTVGRLIFTTEISDYRELDGVKLPFSIQLTEPKQGAFTLTLESVEHGVTIPETTFAKP